MERICVLFVIAMPSREACMPAGRDLLPVNQKKFLGPEAIATIKGLLRRTLVRLYRYGAFIKANSLTASAFHHFCEACVSLPKQSFFAVVHIRNSILLNIKSSDMHAPVWLNTWLCYDTCQCNCCCAQHLCVALSKTYSL